MNRTTLATRSLIFYWRTLLAAGGGVMIACAVIAGALIVGDSMRSSLRAHALRNLGDVDVHVAGQTPFREALATEMATYPTAPLLLARGAAVHSESQRRAENITVYGVTDSFAARDPSNATLKSSLAELGNREVILNQALATQIGAVKGDSVLLRMGAMKNIPEETLLGRRDTATESIRVTVKAVLANDGVASYSLVPQHAARGNAFLKLATMQRALNQKGRINGLLLADAEDESAVETLGTLVQSQLQAADLGLNFRIDLTRGYVGIESQSMLIPTGQKDMLLRAITSVKGTAVPIFTHLANSMSLSGGVSSDSRPIPYSTVAAVPPSWLAKAGLPDALQGDDILLNRWAADTLGVSSDSGIGQTLTMRYYLAGDFGEIAEYDHDFRIAGIVDIDGFFADERLTPEYPGITNTKSISDWDPPFPVDLKKVQDEDDAYWETYRATPKAFICAADGDRLWASATSRFGTHTSIQVYPPDGVSVFSFYQWLIDAVLEQASLADAGMQVVPVRERAQQSGAGSTDFGGLFIGFSFFLIFAAIFLVTLLLKLGISQRTRQIGLMLALGFAPRSVSRLLLLESLMVGVIGALVGLPLARFYAGAMIAGLKSWWSDAVNAPFLVVHAAPMSYVIGAMVAVAVAAGSAIVALRQVRDVPPNTLLTGAFRLEPGAKRSRFAFPLMLIAFITSAGTLAGGMVVGTPPPALAFFLGGASLMVSMIAAIRWRWQSSGSFQDASPGIGSAVPVALRQALRHPDRSLLTIGLLATATFLITALQAFRVNSDFDTSDKASGTGGYSLFAESAVPVLFNLTTASGAENLGLSDDTVVALSDVDLASFRLRRGDDAGCQNLYLPTRPRILGANASFLDRGGFRFSGSRAETELEKNNPWALLTRPLPDGSIPAIGDEASVMWQLHSGLGKQLMVDVEDGSQRPLTFVGLLSGSVLQNEIVVAEDAFKEMFPSESGYGFFLLSAAGSHAESSAALSTALERDLGDFGFDVGHVEDRLAGFFSVQNTYLSTFQSLGGLGMVLGTFGLTAVLLRNIWERRREYALLQAIGFSNRYLQVMTLLETAWLVCLGIVAGLLPAVLAVTPQLIQRGLAFPWLSVLLVLAGVLLVGTLPAWIAIQGVFKQPLIGNLRRE
ncbi:MAG: FtsX-like permease family protein [Phycisphaerae bacterium]